MRKAKVKKLVFNMVLTILVGAFALTMITPFLWMLSASMKLPLDVMELPIKWIPEYFYPNNYKKVWNIGNSAVRDYHFSLAYFNSIKIAGINLVGSVITSTLAGYAFAKLKFKGRDALFLIYLSTMMIPSQVTLIPKFAIFSKLGMINTHLPLILPGLITITGTFLMRQYFMMIPDELRESARIDGAGEFTTWARIMVPIAKPSMASLGMVVFLWNWNAYLEPLVFLNDWRLYTIPLALTNFIEESVTEYNLIMAAASSALIPAFIVFLCGQKFLVKGLTAGAVKG
ncbi:carbohydrate ABC transporter permease [Kineothrix sp. MB12-C1]|uniref:carbohydrate ABC transporter permease n=1 Tax=Kineothrix sp. MB12-C1 TaxID=3070215 RepID=UPI0027D2C5EA|nr:carbohydrate ABC transporter permease [Kineothrix sp. MB12-C1]WMC92366.1 carbohydrate ABC transporter permease [Kineothrix sp. MB12-C1]